MEANEYDLSSLAKLLAPLGFEENGGKEGVSGKFHRFSFYNMRRDSAIDFYKDPIGIVEVLKTYAKIFDTKSTGYIVSKGIKKDEVADVSRALFSYRLKWFDTTPEGINQLKEELETPQSI